MLMLDYMTWIRFAVWMAIGLPIYYFSLKPIDEQKRDAAPIKENQNGKANYYNNVAFVDDTLGPPRKKKAPLPPQINEEKTEVNKIQRELQKFDEMLDEVAHNLETARKSSAGSVSVVMSREENVVADVHCNNIVTPAIPTPPTTPVERPANLPLQKNLNEQLESLEVQKEASLLEVRKKTKRAGSIDSPAPPDTPVSYKSAVGESEGEINDSPSSSSPKHTPPPSPLPTDTIEGEIDNISPTQPSPAPIDTVEEESDNIPSTPPPPPLPVPIEPPLEATKPPESSSDISKPESPVLRVTSSAIKGVNLRTWSKRKEKAKSEYIPGDKNLKLGSDEAKSFKQQLNDKLSTINLPNYIPISKYREPVLSKKGTSPLNLKNENVIEESISREIAREKLDSYINSRLVGGDSSPKNISSNGDRSSLEVANIPLPSSSPTPSDGSESEQLKPVVETVDDAYLAHQNRMKNVFRSMKIVDAPKEPTSPTRIAKSLEHKIDDNAKHRQAMSEIFKSIQLKRKQSTAV